MAEEKSGDKKKANNSAVVDEPDEMDLTVEMPINEALNISRSVFDAGLDAKWGGINTTPSVFDKKAVFKTKKEDD